jgi:hypothetical protein
MAITRTQGGGHLDPVQFQLFVSHELKRTMADPEKSRKETSIEAWNTLRAIYLRGTSSE